MTVVPRARLAIPALIAALVVLALAPPAAAGATSYDFAVEHTGSGAGEVFCKITEPGEELREGEFCEGSWPANTVITFEVPIEEADSEFKGYYEGTGNAANCSGKKTCSFKLTEPSSVNVRFDLIVRSLKINYLGEDKGEVEIEPVCEVEPVCEIPYLGGVEYTYPKGSELTLVPVVWSPSDFFAGWSGGEGSAAVCTGADPCAFALEENSSVTASFEPIELTVQKQGSGQGTVSSETGEILCDPACSTETAPFEEGEEVVLTATAAPGSTFGGWTGGGCGTAGTGPCTVTMNEATTVKATFDAIPPPPAEYTLTVEDIGMGSGTVTSSPAGIDCGSSCSASYEEGTEVILTATAAPGSTFRGWTGGGCRAAGTGPCTVTMGQATTVKATFDASATPPPLPEKEGTATAAAAARVRGGRAALKLTCTGGGPCRGSFKLKARVKKGKRRKNLVIGKASFSLAKGAAKTIKVRLSGPANRELAKRGALKAKLAGSGIESRTVKLKLPRL